MFKKTLLSLSMATMTLTANAHQIWLERDATGLVRVYVGDADTAPDTGKEVADLAASTQVFTTDRKTHAVLTVKNDHLEAVAVPAGDVRLYNDQVWKPWRAKDGSFQAAVFNARNGRTDTTAVLDFELVPVEANGNTFTATFKGQALAGKTVTAINPGKWTKRLKTDAQGRITVPVTEKGPYVLVSEHEAPTNQEIAGQKVSKIGYYATLSFTAP